jgi:hypothetical protein
LTARITQGTAVTAGRSVSRFTSGNIVTGINTAGEIPACDLIVDAVGSAFAEPEYASLVRVLSVPFSATWREAPDARPPARIGAP